MKALEERLVEYHGASVEPGRDLTHEEVMSTLKLVDYAEWQRFERMRSEAPDFWASELTRIERAMAEAQEEAGDDAPVVPRHVTDENRKALDELGGWHDWCIGAEVYVALGIKTCSVKARLLDAIYTRTRRGEPFRMSIKGWAISRNVDRVDVQRALRQLCDEGIVLKVPRPGKPSDLWVDVARVLARVADWRSSKDAV